MSHADAAKDDDAWCDTVHKIPKTQLRKNHTFPVPPCPECVLEPWVVLASVAFPAGLPYGASGTPQMQISYKDRRVLLATQRLQTAMLCLP